MGVGLNQILNLTGEVILAITINSSKPHVPSL